MSVHRLLSGNPTLVVSSPLRSNVTTMSVGGLGQLLTIDSVPVLSAAPTEIVVPETFTSRSAVESAKAGVAAKKPDAATATAQPPTRAARRRDRRFMGLTPPRSKERYERAR